MAWKNMRSEERGCPETQPTGHQHGRGTRKGSLKKKKKKPKTRSTVVSGSRQVTVSKGETAVNQPECSGKSSKMKTRESPLIWECGHEQHTYWDGCSC